MIVGGCSNCVWYLYFRVSEIKSDLAHQIKGDFEDSFQGAGAKVCLAYSALVTCCR